MKKEEIIKTSIVAGTFIVIALIVAAAFGTTNYSNTISVEGYATIEAMPDLAAIYFNVQTEGETAEEAKNTNTEIVDKLKANLIALGFEEDEIKTQNFNIYEKYDWEINKQDGYEASHQIKIEMPIEEKDKIGQAIDAGAEAGAGINYINFELTQTSQNKYKAEAMALAAEDAKIKATATAEGLDKKVGKLVSVSVNNFGYSPWRTYAGGALAIEEDAEMAKAQVTSINPSEEKISATVTATFKLR